MASLQAAFSSLCSASSDPVHLLAGGEGGAIHSLIFPGPQQFVGGSIQSHHISDAMLAPALPTWGQFFPKLRAWVESRNPDGRPVLFVAHNGNSFDVPIVAWESAREGFAMPKEWLYVDTLRLAQKHLNAKQVDPEKGSLRLEHLKRYFQVPSDKAAHRAPADVDVTLHVLSRILQFRCLPIGILYDFVMAFGVADREFRFGLKKDEFAALQDLQAAGEQQRREQEGKERAWPGVLATGAHRGEQAQSPGDWTSGTKDGVEKEGLMMEGGSMGGSLLNSALAHVGEAGGESPAAPSTSVGGPQTAGATELPKRLRAKKAVISPLEVWRLRSKVSGSLEERGSSKGQADGGGGGKNSSGGTVDGEGQGLGPSNASKPLPEESREGPVAAAGVERTLPLLANRQGRLWPRLPLKRAVVANGTPVVVPDAAAEALPAKRPPLSAVGQERDPGGLRTLPPFGKAGELMAHLDDLRERVAKRTPKDPSAALRGEDTHTSAGRAGMLVRGPVVVTNGVHGGDEGAEKVAKRSPEVPSAAFRGEDAEASAGGAGVLVRGPGVVTTGGHEGDEAGLNDAELGRNPSVGDTAAGQLQASARKLKRKGQQNKPGEGLEGSRQELMEGVTDLNERQAGKSTSQGGESGSAASTQEAPTVMERYRLLMAQSRPRRP